ncbi:hypothetical protein RE066_001482 [Klebsiella aerogenes]|nr:hypothetical protein [Klebsiella aerogenes]
MIKSTITRERLLAIADDNAWVKCTHGEVQELARMALAAMDGEPVAWRWRSGPDKRWHLASRGELAGEVEPLYRHAQPAPVVPEEMYWQDAPVEGSTRAAAYASGWNACRAAMLQAGNCRENANSSTNNFREIAETSTNSPAIGIDMASCPDRTVEVRYVAPPGYVMVPVEPNGDMLAAAQDAYGETDGDIASTLRAAIAAAPQEVKDAHH